MKRAMTDQLRRLLLGSGFLGSLLLLASCGVTEPNTDDWQDVREFSWPTELGTTMTYKSVSQERDKEVISEDYLLVNYADVTPFGVPMYKLAIDTTRPSSNPVENERLFLPTEDSLIVEKQLFGDNGVALKAPIEKGHSWLTDEEGTWEAEIVEIYSYRKVEGVLYNDVVAVRTRGFETDQTGVRVPSGEEVIRLYARGIGEIMAIKNIYPKSSSSTAPTIPEQYQRFVLVATSATQAE